MTPHDSTRCACGHGEAMHTKARATSGRCYCNGDFLHCPCERFTPLAPSEAVGAVDFAAADSIAREYDENPKGATYATDVTLARAYLALREQVATLTAGFHGSRAEVALLGEQMEKMAREATRDVEALEAALARATSAEGEAVAWGVMADGATALAALGMNEEAALHKAAVYNTATRDNPYRVIPLFTTPPRSPATVTEAITLPTDDEAWQLYRSIRRMFRDEQDAIVRYTRVLLTSLSTTQTEQAK
jgi:hypothetical protein